jgi:hypothetical protein
MNELEEENAALNKVLDYIWNLREQDEELFKAEVLFHIRAFSKKQVERDIKVDKLTKLLQTNVETNPQSLALKILREMT